MNGLTAHDYQDLILSVGTHSSARRLSPLEVAQLLHKAIEAGETRRGCAVALGVGTTQVSTFLKLLAVTPEIQHLADWRGSKHASIPFSTLAELSRLRAPDQVDAAQAVLRHDLTWKEIVQLVQIVDRSGKTLQECIADVLNLRPHVETRHLFIGAITSACLESHLRSLAQSDRDHMMTQLLTRIIRSDYAIQGRLGFKEFTILSVHNLPRLLNQKPDELEHAVNEFLETLRPST